MSTLKSEIRALAHRHLDNADADAVTLLRRLDKKLQEREEKLALYQRKEGLLDSVAEFLQEGAHTPEEGEVNSMMSQIR